MYILSIISLSAVSSHSCGLECSSQWLSILPTDESICETRERQAETEQRWPTGRTFCNIQEFHLPQTLRPPAKLKLFLHASVFLGFGYVSVWFTPRQRNTSGSSPRPPPTRHSFLLYDMFWCLQCLLFYIIGKKTLGMWLTKNIFFRSPFFVWLFSLRFLWSCPCSFCRYFAIVGIPLFPSVALCFLQDIHQRCPW